MKDANGVHIEPGQTLERIIQTSAATVGHRYTVLQRNWHADDEEGEDLIADGGFIKELITPDRAKEYKVVGE